MKALKIAGLVVAGLIGLAIIAAIALLLVVDPNRHRGAIEARVHAATGRPFAITGTIKLKLFPWLALDVGKVSLGSPDGFGAAPLLTAERVRVGARLLPLVRGELDVSRVAVDGLSVNLVRRADGHSNWEGLGRREPAAAAAGGSALADVSVAGVDVSHATVMLRDEGKQALTRIRDLELHTGALGPARAVDVEFGARLDSGDGTPATRILLRTRATVDTERSLATLAGLTLSGERIPAAAGATPVPFSVASPEVAFDWNAGTLAPVTFTMQLGEFALSAEAAGEQLLGTRLVKGRLRVAEQSPRRFAPSLGWPLPATRDPNAFTRLAGTAAFRLSGAALALEELDLTLDRTRLRGRVAVADVAAPHPEIDLRADSVDIDSYRAPAAAAEAAGKAPAASRLPFAALRALSAQGSLSIEHATVAGLALSEVRVPFTALAGDLRLAPSAKAFGGTSTGELRLDAARDPATLTLTAHVRDVDLGAAVKAYAHSDRLSGRSNADAKLSGQGTTDAALIASLAGPIDFEVKNGAVEGIDVSYEIESAQALLQGQAPPARSGPARTPFNVLSGRSQLEHGVLASDPLRLETQFLKVSGKGTFRLVDQAVDYALTARLEEVPANLAALRSVDIPIAITGTVHDYKVRPDLAGIVKSRVKQELEKRKEELNDKLKEALKNLLTR